MKNKWPYLISTLIAVIFIGGIMGKDKLNELISQQMQQNSSQGQVDDFIRINYNYQHNGKNYDFTLLEFGSTGCSMCKQMEPVLEEMSKMKTPKVNVVFLHIMKPENQELMAHYGISAVPMQVVLNQNGTEIFRNYGVISAADLHDRINSFSNSN